MAISNMQTFLFATVFRSKLCDDNELGEGDIFNKQNCNLLNIF